MQSKDFDLIVERRLQLIKEILLKKRAEYAPEGGDRLHNFQRAADTLGCTKERALVGMWMKHIVSILDIVDSLEPGHIKEAPSVALVEEKIGDAINYLILLEAMLKDRILGSLVELIKTAPPHDSGKVIWVKAGSLNRKKK